MIATIKAKQIEIYINTSKKTMSAVKSEVGCTHIINGGYFENWTPCCHLKANGKVYTTDTDYYWGYGWNDASDFKMTRIPDKSFKNYIAAVDILRNGQNGSMNYKPEHGGLRERSAIGRKADGSIVLYCNKSGRTPEQLREEMRAAGCADAIMLDGGASSQANFAGQQINGSRKVQNFICIWADDAAGSDNGAKTTLLMKGSSGSEVRALQTKLKDLGKEIDVDGDFGSQTDAAVRSIQTDLKLTVDGKVGDKTMAAIDTALKFQQSGNELVLTAGKYLGVAEPKGDNAFIADFNNLAGSNLGDTAAWCQIFAVCCMNEAGLDPYITASCTLAYNHYMQIGAARTEPATGALIYFDWDSSGDCDHVGIVAVIADGYVYVIEGNSSGIGEDAVRMKRYPVTDKKIRGYAMPDVEKPKEKTEYYIVILNKTAAEKLAKDYGGEVVKYEE